MPCIYPFSSAMHHAMLLLLANHCVKWSCPRACLPPLHSLSDALWSQLVKKAFFEMILNFLL